MFRLELAAETINELRDKTLKALDQMGNPPMTPVQMDLPVQRMLSVIQSPEVEQAAKEFLNNDTKEEQSPQESSIDGVNVSDLDKDGRVWDERIDSPMKTKNQYGKWKAKIGVNKTDRIRIIEQLKMKPESQALPANTQEQVAAPQAAEPEIEQETPAESLPAEHMTLEHFGNNFPTVMSGLFNTNKITTERVQQLCEIARVKQAYEIPLNETSLKAVYNNLIQVGLI
jgi:hypothetical protein